MDNCIFCKIIRGEIPSRKVYEDENTLSFMDVAGDVDGHILVIPKKHVTNVLDCDEETLAQTMSIVKKVANHLVDNCGYEGVNILNASGQPAGQTVFHQLNHETANVILWQLTPGDFQPAPVHDHALKLLRHQILPSPLCPSCRDTEFL